MKSLLIICSKSAKVSNNINEVIKEISNLFIFYEEILTYKNMKKKYISKHALKKRLKRKSFIHLFAFYAF